MGWGRNTQQSTFLGPGGSFGKQLGIFKTTQKNFFSTFFYHSLPHRRAPAAGSGVQRSPQRSRRGFKSIYFLFFFNFCPGIT